MELWVLVWSWDWEKLRGGVGDMCDHNALYEILKQLLTCLL